MNLNKCRVEREFKSKIKVYYSDGIFRTFNFSDYNEYNNFMLDLFDNPSVCRIEDSNTNFLVYETIPDEGVI